MSEITERLTDVQIAAARERRLEAMNLQEIEGNPLDADQVAMFEMFEREGWVHERCTAYLLERARRNAVSYAAE
jgi:uncharacterized protein YjhX (UPF0386 family)